MNSLYSITARLAEAVLPITSVFSEKMRQFVSGRKETFNILESKIGRDDKVIWFHMASLGEFEQGLPIIDEIKEIYPHHKIVISFFSPSGYEIKKNTPVAQAVVYLPLDTPKNVTRFLDRVHPDLVLFIKYEFWPNYLREVKERGIPALLISGGFRKEQLFFKPHGAWMRKSLSTFDHFFVQNKISRELLKSVGFDNVTVSGDTRFDRVAKQLELDNDLDFIDKFKNGNLCIVCGSTWPEDEELLEKYINNAPSNVKFILAPHKIKAESITRFREKINKEVLLFSEKEGLNPADYRVFIIDTIGILTKIYSYADIAYVGGGAGNTGLHNILEPATFGVPVVIGRNFKNFPEAIQLQKLAGLYSVSTEDELLDIFSKLVEDKKFRTTTGMIAGHFISNNTGATRIVSNYLNENLKKL